MKVVIADDEFLAREGLKSLLQDLGLSIEIVGLAVNGEDAVNMIKRSQPDVAFIDIKMPIYSGLDVIKMCKDISPHTQWVILSGFSEFDFAREAIRLTVNSYLLKPIGLDELQSVMLDVLEKKREYVSRANKQFENDIVAVSYELQSLADFDSANILRTGNFYGWVLLFDSYIDEEMHANYQLKLCSSLRQTINEIADNYARMALYVLPNGKLAIIAGWDSSRQEQRTFIKRYFAKMDETVRRYNNELFSVSIIETNETCLFSELQRDFEWIERNSFLRVLCGVGAKWTVKGLDKKLQELSGEYSNICHALIRLSDCYKAKNYLGYVNVLEHLDWKTIKKCDIGTQRAIFQFLTHSVPVNIQENQDIDEWVKRLLEHADQLIFDKKTDSNDIAAKATKFINDNYMLNISINQIACQLNITPNYLSALFHKKTGTTFIKFLTRLRMYKAKELLANPSLQVQQVAEKVGYFSPRHFAKQFKEFYGVYPSKYQEAGNGEICGDKTVLR